MEGAMKAHLLIVCVVNVAVMSTTIEQGRGIPGSLVFYSARTGNNEIFVMDADGTDPVRITTNPASDVDPDISPNGWEIAFSSNRTGNNDIFVTDRDGLSVVNLTSNPGNDGWPRWSPNGQQIAFHSNRDGNFEIYLMNADGSNVTRLTDYPGVDQYPDWSPDGKEIVFRRDIDIYAIELTDGTIRRLTQAPILNQMAAWSPNGKQIAFMSLREGYCAVFVMNADGSGQSNLTPKHPADLDADWCSRAPSWSTDGREIYFMSFRPATQGDAEIFVMNADGTAVRRLTYTIGTDGSPRTR
jgi:Tol biopolymer transport system component